MRWTSLRTINAAAELVFRIVADPVEFQRAVGADPNVEFLTTQRAGVGARFRARRTNQGKEMVFEHEVTRHVAGQLVEMVNVTHGVLWDSTFEVNGNDRTATLSLTMSSKTSNPLKRLMMRFIAPMVQRALDKDMDAVKGYAEGPAR
jgi:uncharacterized protein YndB with AHSA1/START domain